MRVPASTGAALQEQWDVGPLTKQGQAGGRAGQENKLKLSLARCPNPRTVYRGAITPAWYENRLVKPEAKRLIEVNDNPGHTYRVCFQGWQLLQPI